MSSKTDKVISSRNHSFDAFRKMKSLREKNSLCDVNIKVGDTTIAAHRVVLASCSPFFEFMFTGKVKENGKAEIELKDLCPEAVSMLTDYVYSGVLVVNDETIIKVLETADFLQITSAKEECLKFLQKNINALNCIDIKYLAKKYFFTELENKANNFIRWNFLEIIKTEAFLKLTLDQVKEFLSDSSFCLISSSCKQAVSSWIQYDKPLRKEYENDLLKTIVGIVDDEPDLYNPHRQKRIYIFDENSGYNNVAFVDLNNSTLYNVSRRPQMNKFSCVSVKNSIFLVDTFDGIFCQYDIELEKWTKNEMESVVGFHNRACNVHDRIFLVAEGTSKNSYNFDVETNVLLPQSKLIYQRTYPGVALHGNCVYVCGGNSSSPSVAERLDVRTKMWNSIAQMSNSLLGRCSAAALGEYIYCACVDLQFVNKYDPRNGKWITCSSIPNSGNGSNTTISSADGNLYAVNNKGIYRYEEGSGWNTISCPMYSNNPTPNPACLCFVPE